MGGYVKPRLLVACEVSQIVTAAFRRRGVEAYSCDILPTEGNLAWHIQGDVLAILRDGWDAMIAFPPCTYLSRAGARWWKEPGREPACSACQSGARHSQRGPAAAVPVHSMMVATFLE